MANKNRQSTFDIKEQLITSGKKFSFIQAYRLINGLISESITPEQGIARLLNIHPELSLCFPSSDIAKIAINDEEQYDITATFMGLYGTSSPLPTFYTENLLKEQSEDNNLGREFIDIFNNQVYHLLFKIWSSNNLGYKIFEEHDTGYLSNLYSLGGLDNSEIQHLIPNSYNLIRYIGILGHLPRSAFGLKTFLIDILDIAEINIIEFEETTLSIPQEQQFALGLQNHQLGDNTHLGHHINSVSQAFTIEIGPLPFATYSTILPGSDKEQLLQNIVKMYVNEPLTWQINKKVIGEEIPGIALGCKSGAQLGLDSWLMNKHAPIEEVYTVNVN